MTFNFVSGVPAWTEGDDGCDDYDYGWVPGDKWCDDPDNSDWGVGQDAWGYWDGCAPIAGAMIAGYDTGRTRYAWKEWYIDALHHHMNTDLDGISYPWDIASGMGNLHSKINDDRSWSTKHITRWGDSQLTNQIDGGRPLFINMLNGGEGPDYTESDNTDTYGNHTCVVTGYHFLDTIYGKDKYIYLHNTWDNGSHFFTWGNWDASSIIQTNFHE